MPTKQEEGLRPKILYLIGTARCGSTALAATLNFQSDIDWQGELIHLVTALPGGSLCSCSREIADCDAWRRKQVEEELQPTMEFCHQFESHWAAPATMINARRIPDEYGRKQAIMISQLCAHDSLLLDSSKYLGRALALAASASVNARFIYLVRDPRGVVHSYSKKVQSGRSLLSACMYYTVVNSFAEIATRWRLRGRFVKIRYEDLLRDPESTLDKIGQTLAIDTRESRERLRNSDVLKAEHVAGGNRWVRAGAAPLRRHDAWRGELGFTSRLLVYVLCFPLQLINRYKL